MFDSGMWTTLGWTLVHFVWQAAFVAWMLAVVWRRLDRSGPQLRYVIGCTAMASLLVLPLVTFTILSHGEATARPALVWLDTAARSASTGSIVSDLRSSVAGAVLLVRDGLGVWTGELARFWSVVVGLLWLRLLISFLRVRGLRRRDTEPVAAELAAASAAMAGRLGIRRPVALLRSTRVDVPAVVGWLRPMILLPVSACIGLTPRQIEAVIAHELAHIRRHDPLINLVQSLVDTLFFYHPAVWWMSRRIRTEREHCCDDLAVTLTGDPVQYARALARLEEARRTLGVGRFRAAALAATGSGEGELVQRIRRLVALRTCSDESRPAVLTLAALAGLAAFVGVGAGVAASRSVGPVPEPPVVVHASASFSSTMPPGVFGDLMSLEDLAGPARVGTIAGATTYSASFSVDAGGGTRVRRVSRSIPDVSGTTDGLRIIFSGTAGEWSRDRPDPGDARDVAQLLVATLPQSVASPLDCPGHGSSLMPTPKSLSVPGMMPRPASSTSPPVTLRFDIHAGVDPASGLSSRGGAGIARRMLAIRVGDRP